MYDIIDILPIRDEIYSLFKILCPECGLEIESEIRVYSSDLLDIYYGISYISTRTDIKMQRFFHPTDNGLYQHRRPMIYNQIHQIISDFIKSSKRNDKIEEVLNG